jgi:NTE family protein
MNWNSITWKDGIADGASLTAQLVTPIRQMAATSIDVSSVIWGALSPWATINDEVSASYDKVLFQGKTLQDLPDDSGPRFVINATNVKTGSLWRFSRPYMADYRIGIVDNPSVSLAHAVAASSAFPPFLSPMRLSLDGFVFRPNVPEGHNDQTLRSLRGEAVLTDGGVYDNLGLEAVWKRYKTVLVSDGGRKMDDDPSPAGDWARHSRRLIDLLQHEVSNLRRRMVFDSFIDKAEPHKGTYWGIQTNLADYGLKDDTLKCPHEATDKIARIETRLTALSDTDQKQIINWGYAVCDAAVRKYVPGYDSKPAAKGFVYPEVGVGN